MVGSDSLIPDVIRLLLVEGSRSVVQLTKAYLSTARRTRFITEQVSDLASAIKMVQREEFGVVLLDLELSDSEGIETFIALNLRAPDIPIIVFTSEDDKELAVEAISLGAKDYLVKSKVDADGLLRSIYYSLERQKLEDRLTAMGKGYRRLIDSAGEGIGIVDDEEVFRYANPAGCSIFGVAAGTLAGRKLTEFLDEENLELVKKQTQNRKRGRQNSYEMKIIRADGERRTILLTATPQIEFGYEVVGTVGVFRDITDQKDTENTPEE